MPPRPTKPRVIHVTLPLPESVNHALVRTADGGTERSGKSKKFFREATEALSEARDEGRIPRAIIRDGIWQAEGRFYLRRADSDADNRHKQALDAIQARAVKRKLGTTEKFEAERFAVLDDDARIGICGPFLRLIDDGDPRFELTLTEVMPDHPYYEGLKAGLPPRFRAENGVTPRRKTARKAAPKPATKTPRRTRKAVSL